MEITKAGMKVEAGRGQQSKINFPCSMAVVKVCKLVNLQRQSKHCEVYSQTHIYQTT